MIFGDIIRFIVVNYHPSNEQLKGGKAKRWEVIGYLLSSTTDLLALAYGTGCLVFDWLFYTK